MSTPTKPLVPFFLVLCAISLCTATASPAEEPYFDKALKILRTPDDQRRIDPGGFIGTIGSQFNDSDSLRMFDIETRHVFSICFDKPSDNKLRDCFVSAALSEVPVGYQAVPPADATLATARQFFWRSQAARLLEVTEKTVAYIAASKRLPADSENEWVAMRAELETLLKTEGDAQYAAISGDAAWTSRFTRLARFRRAVLFLHPDLQFERLLINRHEPPLYSHNCDQYLGRHSRPGRGIGVLDDWQSSPKLTEPLAGKLPAGDTARPNLSYDGQRILFAFCDHTPNNTSEYRFFLYEATLDETGSKALEVRQITGTASDPMEGWGGRTTVAIEDFDPCYLPDGGIAFTSTRSQCFGRCHGGRYTPSYLIYRCEPDGSDLRMISYGEANEHFPSVLHDGRIAFTRWEYINRNQIALHKLWSIKPDGTGVANFYGSNTVTPWSIMYHDNAAQAQTWYDDLPKEVRDIYQPYLLSETRPIPGSRKVVATAAAHHSYTAGSLVLIDPEIGEDGPDAIHKLTPEVPYPESEDYFKAPGNFQTPWPINEQLFFAAYSPLRIYKQRTLPPESQYAIYLVDSFGGREPIWREAGSSCSPMPLEPRPSPPALPRLVQSPGSKSPETGTLVIQNVYITRNDPEKKIKPGSIRYLRINEILPQPRNGARSVGSREDFARRILGTVPVNSDGSVIVIVPAKTPIHLQLLDENKMAVLTERSLFHVMPGEVRSCVGCHEEPGTAPLTGFEALRQSPRPLQPPVGPRYEGGFSFRKTVQPVLDRYCIRCHGLTPEKIEENVNLIGAIGGGAKPDGMPVKPNFRNDDAYITLTTLPGLVKMALRKGNGGPDSETGNSRPFDYYAHAGRLIPMLQKGHCKVRLDDESMTRLIQWLDLNAIQFGDYHREDPFECMTVAKDDEKILREHVKTALGSQWADDPITALVNMANPPQSRVLMAPLALEAGGWGQVEPGWKSKEDPGYLKMAAIVNKASRRPEHTAAMETP